MRSEIGLKGLGTNGIISYSTVKLNLTISAPLVFSLIFYMRSEIGLKGLGTNGIISYSTVIYVLSMWSFRHAVFKNSIFHVV